MPIVQYQPLPVEADGDHRMDAAAPDIAHDHQSQVVGDGAGFTQRDVFGDGVILAIARSRREGGKWRRPDVVDAMLHRVRHEFDAQIDRPIDLADPRAALTLVALLNDSQKCARGSRAVTVVGTTRGERLFVRANTGLQGSPLCQCFVWFSRRDWEAKWFGKHRRARFAAICLAWREHGKPCKAVLVGFAFGRDGGQLIAGNFAGKCVDRGARFRRIWIC